MFNDNDERWAHIERTMVRYTMCCCILLGLFISMLLIIAFQYHQFLKK